MSDEQHDTLSNEIRRVADMAMIPISEEHFQKLAVAVQQMLEYFAVMNSVDIDNIEPTTHALVSENKLRPDTVYTADTHTLLDIAPECEDGLITVPNVL